VYHRPVTALVLERLPRTLAITTAALVLAFGLGTGLGVIQAQRQGSRLDRLLGAASLAAYSLPRFFVALLLLFVFAYRLGWVPVVPSLAGSRAQDLLLPCLALGLPSIAVVARYTRARMIDALQQGHVLAARALGLPEWQVITGYALRSALGPVLALLGLSLPAVFSGSVVVERVFGVDGMGSLFVGAIGDQDTPLVVGLFFVYALLVVLGNAAADLLVLLLDPRQRA